MMTMMVDRKGGSHDNNSFHGLLTNSTVESNKRFKIGGGGGRSTTTTTTEKDKIGERVASLQQLVCPFGKTDTASVLEEATGYIRFLHEQLQVLSVPYLRTTSPGQVQEEEGDDDEYYSLRSRGLCLVPVALTFKIARSNGADLWAQRHSTSLDTKQQLIS